MIIYHFNLKINNTPLIKFSGFKKKNMKKVLLLLAGILLVGCTAEDTATKKEVAKNCNCNRVAAVSSINIIGDARGNITGSTSYYYRTINDCTLLQSDWISNGSTSVKVGDCK